MTNDWGPAQNAGPNINTVCIEWSPSFSLDGKKMFFASGYRRNGEIEWCQGLTLVIYMSEWDTVTNQWGPKQYLGAPSNDGYSHSLAPDDTTLYFSSGYINVPGFQGEEEIYIAFHNGTSWYRIENLGPPVNTASWDYGPSISPDGQKLYFARRVPDATGVEKIFVSEKTPSSVISSEPEVQIGDLEIYQNFPNPFTGTTTIKYQLRQSSVVRLEIYNLNGQKIQTLVNEYQTAGSQSVGWNGKDRQGKTVPSGIYFVALHGSGKTVVKKLILVR